MYTVLLFLVLYASASCCHALATSGNSKFESRCTAPSSTYSQLLCIIKNATRCSTARAERLPYNARKFDFIFALEISYYYNQTRLSFIKDTLQKLMNTTHGSNYGDLSPQFAFLFYPITTNQGTIVATEFKNFYSHENTDTIFNKIVSYTRQLSQFNKSVSTNSLRYITVMRSLQMLWDVAEGNLSAITVEGNKVTLNSRKDSEKHLIIFLDLFENQKKKKGTTQAIDTFKISNEIDKMITMIKDRIDRSSKFVLTVVLDPMDKVGTMTYGDPKYGKVYSDGTHFNKAMTLKALLKAKNKQSNTLQAHLLHKGVHMQIVGFEGLQRIYKSLNPALWTIDSVYSSFINHCASNYQCPYCSSLHGCYQPKLKRSPQSQRYQMAPKFATGEHGSAKSFSFVNRTEFLDEEKLTIYSLPLSSGSSVKLSHVVDGKVSELQWSPNKLFAKTIINGGRPVVLKNSTVSTWPALEKWTANYLKKHLTTSAILESVKCSNNFLTFDPDFHVPLKLNISVPFVIANMSEDDFFSCLHDKCADGYKGHYYFGEVPDELKKDMINDRYLYLTDKDNKAGKQFIWVSSAGMITHTHFDQDYNFFVQISGLKRFTLWTSVQHESLYVYPRVHPMWHKSRINFRKIDPQQFPLFLKSHALQVTVGPGDLLYIPPYTWHYVETLTPSVSLSTWSHDYRLYDHMNSIYKYDHKFDELANPKGLCVSVSASVCVWCA